MSSAVDVVALARQAGLCFPDCHFLDVDPYEGLFEALAERPTEDERSAYLALVRDEETRRQQRLHQLELFAALVLRAGRDQVEAAAQSWQEEDFAIWVGAAKAAARLEVEALVLEHLHQQDEQPVEAS